LTSNPEVCTLAGENEKRGFLAERTTCRMNNLGRLAVFPGIFKANLLCHITD